MRLMLVLLLALPIIASAEDARLGRLFFIPTDRATMDIIRKNSPGCIGVLNSTTISQKSQRTSNRQWLHQSQRWQKYGVGE